MQFCARVGLSDSGRAPPLWEWLQRTSLTTNQITHSFKGELKLNIFFMLTCSTWPPPSLINIAFVEYDLIRISNHFYPSQVAAILQLAVAWKWCHICLGLIIFPVLLSLHSIQNKQHHIVQCHEMAGARSQKHMLTMCQTAGFHLPSAFVSLSQRGCPLLSEEPMNF